MMSIGFITFTVQCLPESNKGLNKDFLILSGEWSDGFPCPTTKGEPGGVLGLGYSLISPFFDLLYFHIG